MVRRRWPRSRRRSPWPPPSRWWSLRLRPPRSRPAGAVPVVVLLVGALAGAACGGDDGRAGPPPSSEAPSSAAPESSPAPGTSPSSPSGPPPETAGPGCDPAAAVGAWPLRRQLAALVVVGVDPAGTTEATAAVEDHHVGGIFVGGNPTGLLTSGALQELRIASPTGLFVAVDEEGGRVQRIEALDGEVPSARDMAATMTPEEVAALARRRARVMAAHGVNVDLAPVVDVSAQPDGAVIGDRSWSDDPEVVTTYARAYANGLLAEGITPALKHFPGHGASTGDTHEGAASVPPLDELQARDLRPYAALLPELGDRTAVMLGHLDVPGLTEDGLPSSLSPATVGLLRQNYGFAGVVMTDDLAAMAAVTDRFGVPEAAERALGAGVDVVLLAQADLGALLDHLEAAVAAGRLEEAGIATSVVRTLDLKGLDPCAVAID